jgi:DNA-directed RNA polymerase specialized sigma24 family protein
MNVVLTKYLNIKKELITTNKILDKLYNKPKNITDYYKDYKTGYPITKNISGYDTITHYKIQQYENKKQRLEKEIIVELNKLESFINEIKNPFIKSVFEYRYIADMKFEEIACKMNNTYGSVKMAHNRYLKRINNKNC